MHIKRLKLINFRKFKNTELELDPEVTVILGKNAQGKSSVLEALSLITNLTSPFSSNYSNLINYTIAEPYFKIEADLQKDNEIYKLVMVCNEGKKKVSINGKKTSNKKYSKLTHTAVFSPEQIDDLMQSPSKRRTFMDDFLSTIDYEYADDLKKFKKILKHRNARLKKLAKRFYDQGVVQGNDKELKLWTDKFAEYSAKLMKKRLTLASEITEQADEISIIYSPTIEWSVFGEMIEIEKLINLHQEDLKEKVKRDIARGFTTLGAHRDDWEFTLEYERRGKNLVVKKVKEYGSRGEKRYSIGKLILQFQAIYNEKLGFYPILLLDDIYSELDDDNMKNLVSKDKLDKQQVVLTGIRDGDWLNKLELNNAKVINLN